MRFALHDKSILNHSAKRCEVQSQCSKCFRQTSIQAYIISVPAIVGVYLTLSIPHFLNDVSSGGGEMSAALHHACKNWDFCYS